MKKCIIQIHKMVDTGKQQKNPQMQTLVAYIPIIYFLF